MLEYAGVWKLGEMGNALAILANDSAAWSALVDEDFRALLTSSRAGSEPGGAALDLFGRVQDSQARHASRGEVRGEVAEGI
jgi:hypothetical protein